MKSTLTLLLTVAALSVHATGKVNNGILPATVVYQCTEVNNPENSPLYRLSEQGQNSYLLDVSLSSGELLASFEVTKNNNVRCILPCDLYDNEKENVSFGVTIIPSKETSIISGNYSLNGESVSLTCSQSKAN